MFNKIFNHGRMLEDQIRLSYYQKAIKETVCKGDVVVDVGTGSGVLAQFALQAGASRVYAIEMGDIIEEAKILARLNGVADRITFINDRSDRVQLPEKADVIISEIIGFFGLDEDVLRFQNDFRDRLLKPGGKLVPCWLKLFITPVVSTALWNKYISYWRRDYFGVDFSPVKETAVNKRYLTESDDTFEPIASTAELCHFDFYRLQNIPVSFKSEFIVPEPAVCHGFIGTFDVGLNPNTCLSTRPGQPVTCWHHMFFPLAEEMSLQAGDGISLVIKTIPRYDAVYWEWNSSISRDAQVIRRFSQSNFALSREELAIGRPEMMPRLNVKGRVRRRIFELCDGGQSLQSIATHLVTEFPDQFTTTMRAMQTVVEILRDYITPAGS
jgi:type I protein arginine methyltransferase